MSVNRADHKVVNGILSERKEKKVEIETIGEQYRATAL
jgi:hypothetical protein